MTKYRSLFGFTITVVVYIVLYFIRPLKWVTRQNCQQIFRVCNHTIRKSDWIAWNRCGRKLAWPNLMAIWHKAEKPRNISLRITRAPTEIQIWQLPNIPWCFLKFYEILCHSHHAFSYVPYFFLNLQNALIKIKSKRSQNPIYIRCHLLRVAASGMKCVLWSVYFILINAFCWFLK